MARINTVKESTRINTAEYMLLVLAKLLRGFSKARFRLLNLATIKDISTEDFNQLIARLAAEGWQKRYEYSGFDAWIDYGCVKLRKGSTTLKLEWDNWTEGSVEGLRSSIETLAKQTGLSITNAWRWSDYDPL